MNIPALQPIKLRRIVAGGAFALGALSATHTAPAASAKAQNPPNIVVILSDDQGWTDYGFMGHPVIKTPHLDRLAANSLLFPHGYVAAPICRPSLASIITGLLPSQHGVTGNDVVEGSTRVEADLPLRQAFHQLPSIVRMLSENGYLTFQSGKWWEGSYLDGGFTHGMTHGDPARGGRHGDAGLDIGREGMEPIREFVDQAIQADKPFFVWYAPFLPHTPHNPPERLLEKYVAQGRAMDVARYFAMCEWFDETCGELIEILRQRGVIENTLIVYICDNGEQPPSTNAYDSPEGDWRPPYARRTKGTPFDMGIRTPVMLSMPGTIEPEKSPKLAHAIDLFPTIAAVAGLTPPPGLPGMNLLDRDAVAARERVFAENHSSHNITIGDPEDTLQYLAAVEEDWKLILRKSGRDTTRYHVLHSWDDEPARLYRIREDPSEQNNLAEKHPDQVRRLKREIESRPKP
jgi:arylsulfatase A-like enzyme